MHPWGYSDASPGEFGAQLVKTASGNTLGGAVNEEGGNGGVVGGLLGNVRHPNWPVLGVGMPCD